MTKTDRDALRALAVGMREDGPPFDSESVHALVNALPGLLDALDASETWRLNCLNTHVDHSELTAAEEERDRLREVLCENTRLLVNMLATKRLVRDDVLEKAIDNTHDALRGPTGGGDGGGA